MSTGKSSLFVLLLGASFHVGESQHLSSAGCTCKSECDKSWLHSGGPWCYVDGQCKADGWDSCQDVQMLYASAIKEKAQEGQALDDAQKTETALKAQLAEANKRLKETATHVASLNQKLKETSASEATMRKRAEKAELMTSIDEAHIKDIKEKLAKSERVQSGLNKSVDELADAAEATMAQMNQKLTDAEDMKGQNKVTIKVMQQKIMQGEKALEKAAMISEQNEKRLLQGLTAAETKVKDTEEKLAETSEKHSAEAELTHKEDEAKLAKQVKDDAEAMLKLKASNKEDLKAAHVKQQATEHKLEEMEVMKTNAEKKLKESQTNHDETKKHLSKALTAADEAKLDAKMYKIFKDANTPSKTAKPKPALRAIKKSQSKAL